jgi:hypothetical protein
VVVLGTIVVVAPSEEMVAVVAGAAVPVPLQAAATSARAAVTLTGAFNPIRTPYE